MRIRKIEKYMTSFPHSIHSAMPLKTAREMMRKYEIRHLPVQQAGQLVGILTDRDLKLGASFDQGGTLTVEDVMTPDPYSVSPLEPLAQVAGEMAKHKYGCAIVKNEKGKVIGIFTATDALALLSKQEKAKPRRTALGKKKLSTRKEEKNETHRSLD